MASDRSGWPTLSAPPPLPQPPCVPDVAAGKGDELPGRPAQDLVFVVRLRPHPSFVRDGDDLVATVR